MNIDKCFVHKQVSVFDVYSEYPANIKIPAGYKIKESQNFRIPLPGDIYLSVCLVGDCVGVFRGDDGLFTNPRLILEKVKRKRVVFEEAENGNFVEGVSGALYPVGTQYCANGRTLYTRREEEF